MINLLRRVRQQYLKEGNYRIYAIYALGEVVLVMTGILLALQVDNWNQKRLETKQEIDNIENLYFSINEDIQLEVIIWLVEGAIRGEQMWIDYLTEITPFHDSLLVYAYTLGVTAHISPNTGFYESLKQQGLETIENKTLRMWLSLIFEQNLPEIQNAMDHYDDHFGEERSGYFKSYFELGQSRLPNYGDRNLHIDYIMFDVARLKNEQAMKSDQDFLDFVRISLLFHQNLLGQLNRALLEIEKAKNLVSYELNYARYGTPKRQEITISLEGYLDMEEVYILGEFNNWRPDRVMMRTARGWERSFDLFPGSYEYKFYGISNNPIPNQRTWFMDPANPDSAYVPDVGSWNSVINVSH